MSYCLAPRAAVPFFLGRGKLVAQVHHLSPIADPGTGSIGADQAGLMF